MLPTLEQSAISDVTGVSTKAITIGNNANRLLLVTYGTYQGGGPSGITANGRSLTKIVEQVGSFGEQASIWGLVAPDVGAQNVVISGLGNWAAYGILSIKDAKQSLPTLTAVQGGDSGSMSKAITSLVNDTLLVASLEAEPTISMTTSGATEDYNKEGQSFQHAEGHHYGLATAGAKTFSANLGYGARWNMCICGVEPAPVITTTSITKSLGYSIKRPVAITKSLKYTTKTTPSAVTKALKYTVKKTATAVTKSLAYYVRKGISITKGLIYDIKKPVALTKSLKYAVDKGAAGNPTKALKYTVKVTPTAKTKGLQYAIRPIGLITKSLKYSVKSSVASTTKSLKYTVKKTASAITKVVRYTVKGQPPVLGAPTVITGTSGSLTVPACDGLLVATGTHQGDITAVSWNGNALTAVTGANAATDFQERSKWWYLPNPTPGTGTLSMSSGGDGQGMIAMPVYGAANINEIPWTPPVAISPGGASSSNPSVSIATQVINSLVVEATYAEAARTGVGSGQTSLGNVNISSFQNFFASYQASPTVTTVVMDNATASGQRYAEAVIVLEPVYSVRFITKNLVYAVKKNISITKSLKYTVKKAAAITKSLAYALKVKATITKALTYGIKTRFYTKEALAVLPTNGNDVANAYTNAEYNNTLAIDGIRTSQVASNGDYAVHVFRARNTQFSTQAFIKIQINLRSDVSAATSGVFLQVFNRTSGNWETIGSNTTTGAGTDINLTGYITSNQANYYNGSGYATFRVYQKSPATATDFQNGTDMMGLTKDLMRQSMPDLQFSNHINQVAADFPTIDSIGISFVNNTQAEAAALGVGAFAEEPWARKNRVMDMIHSAGKQVEDRFTDSFFEGLYDFPSVNKRNGNRYTMLALPIEDNFENTGTRQHGYGLTSPGGSFSRYLFAADAGNDWTFLAGKIRGPASNGWRRSILFNFDNAVPIRNYQVLALMKKVGHQAVVARGTTDLNFPGYSLQLRDNAITVERSGLEQIGSGVSKTMTEGNWFWVRFQAYDYDLKGKVWAAGGESESLATGLANEPGSWDIQVTDNNTGSRISPESTGFAGFTGESNFGEFAYLAVIPQHDADTWLARGLDPVITNIAHYADGDLLSAYPEANEHSSLTNQGSYNQFFIDWAYCVDAISATYGKALNGRESGHLMTYALQGQYNTLFNAVGVASVDHYGPSIGRGFLFGSFFDDQGATRTQTYAVPTSLSEASANKKNFIPEKIAYNKEIWVYITNKGTGDLTLTIHGPDGNPVKMYDHTNLNNSFNSYQATILNAALPSSGWVSFKTDWVNLQTDQTHHFHLTSTVAGTTVKTGTLNDLNTASVQGYKGPATAEAYEIDIRNLARITGKPVKIKEFGDYWSKDASRTSPILSDAEQDAYLDTYFAALQRLKDDGILLGFTWWRTGFGLEGLYNNAGGPSYIYVRNHIADRLKVFFDANPDSSPQATLSIDWVDIDFVLPGVITKLLRYAIRKSPKLTKLLTYVVRHRPYTKNPNSPFTKKDSPYRPFG